MADCSECEGSGKVCCPRCDGAGCELSVIPGLTDECPQCYGHCEIECPECHGTGDA
jgi:hypothetical protein